MYDESGARFQSIQQLMQQINNTTDLKGVAEIQARLEAENAQLLNELIRLQAMNGMIGQQQKIQAQQQQQQQYQLYHASY
jgi:type IV secretion system protein VirB5